VVRGPGELLPNHRCQLAMMEDSSVEFFCPWVKCSLMKGNINLDWGLCPSFHIWFVLPAIHTFDVARMFASQLSIDMSPISASHISRMKVWVPDDFEEMLKARLRLLVPVIPIPFSK